AKAVGEDCLAWRRESSTRATGRERVLSFQRAPNSQSTIPVRHQWRRSQIPPRSTLWASVARCARFDPGITLASSNRKKLAAFSAAAGRFLQFPIGDRRCNRTRASVGNAGGNARQALQTRL